MKFASYSKLGEYKSAMHFPVCTYSNPELLISLKIIKLCTKVREYILVLFTEIKILFTSIGGSCYMEILYHKPTQTATEWTPIVTASQQMQQTTALVSPGSHLLAKMVA